MAYSDTRDLLSVRDFLRYAVSRFGAAGLFFGHGSQSAFDEAAYLILHTLHLPLDKLEPFLDARLTPAECSAVLAVIERREVDRVPAAYITREAWLKDYRFYVDERVIVPRSYFAELLDDALRPWIEAPERVERVLDLCTGSGCLAIMAAHAFPDALIDAADISAAALEVAQRNVADYRLEDRIELVHSDVFAALAGRSYDLIVSNPPYVTAESMRTLPPEYRHEPALSLAAGEDGLDVVRRILAQAQDHLRPGGLLALEVGHNRPLVEDAFPRLPFTWVASESGTEAVFLIQREQLR